MNKKKTRNSRNFHNSDSAQSFADILRQTADMHRDDPRDSIKRLLAIARHTESVTDADETVTIPRGEYNNLLAAKTTLVLLQKIATNVKESAFVSVREILQLISGDSPTDVTADT